MAFIDRYLDDQSAPTVPEALKDLATRALAPALVLFGALLGLGYLIVGPLGSMPAEDDINRSVQATRTPLWDNVTAVWSHIGNTEIVIGVCVVAVALLWWRLRQLWVAVIPAIAISLQATIFVIVTTLTDRQRPHVPHLDPAPPTSSYPSGHVGASTALYVTFAFLAQRIDHPGVRRFVTAVCLLIPLLVAYARVYRGMHHLSDVTLGLVNGLVCAILAWRYLKRRTPDGQTRA